MTYAQKDRYDIGDLLEIIAILRAPGGCPWDREQTHESIRRNFLEETYEVAEAIDTGDRALLLEELGDVLMQVVFHAQIEKESGTFDFSDVCDGICKKMILRHPHIFSDVKADTADEVLTNWDAIKKAEKRQETQADVLRSVSKALPALMRAEKIQAKAQKAGYDGGEGSAAADLKEKAAAFEESNNPDTDMGALLFAAVRVARQRKLDPEACLEKACDDFIERFSETEKPAAIEA
ncbi:MAG: nucleoside triphosphate pyrophosphohydrolase [Oscillospiraceae bacterium]|jgi:tetrapyrrole methylase family protein/MazG family protein|nr:nucleoside triphosphate pyrophosphohydrolase [Oscillospiraceae bacterium]